MKKRIITIALVAITSITSQLFAQEVSAAARSKSGYNLKENVKARVSQNDGKTMAADDWDPNNANAAKGKHFPKAVLVCRVTPTDGGCIIALEHNVQSPRDAASGLATGRRSSTKPMTKFFEVSSSSNAVTEIKSPRDAARGLPTGKRMHKPFVITKELDKSSPQLSETVSKNREASAPSISEIVVTKLQDKSSAPLMSEIAIDEPGVEKTGGGGSGKASFSDLSVMSAGKATFKEFTVTKRCDGKTTTISCPDGECDIPLDDCPNGSCDLVCSWSWGATNTGSMSSGSGAGSGRCAAGFSLEIEDGACTAITKKDVVKGSYDVKTTKI
jgi:hypothetical protein